MTGKGLPPCAAAYFTGTDHRRQVEAADVRRAKRRDAKRRRRLDAAAIAGDERTPADVRPGRTCRHHTGRTRPGGY